MRIGDENRLELQRIHLIKIGAQDRRFSHADFARDQHKSLTFRHAIRDGGQSLLMTGTRKEERWIWGNMERNLLQMIKVEIHTDIILRHS